MKSKIKSQVFVDAAATQDLWGGPVKNETEVTPVQVRDQEDEAY